MKLNREDYRSAIPQLEKRIDGLLELEKRIDGLLDFFYPVGTVYETLDGKFNPNKVWGGKWERIKGKTLVGVDEDDTDFVDGASGGEKKHTLTESEMPSHAHNLYFGQTGYGRTIPASKHYINATGSVTYTTVALSDRNYAVSGVPAGGGGSHNNMPPYITVYMWKRIA